MNSPFSPLNRRTNGGPLISIIPSSRQATPKSTELVKTAGIFSLFGAIVALTAVLWHNVKNGNSLFGNVRASDSAYDYQQPVSAMDPANGGTQRGYSPPASPLPTTSASPARDHDLTTSGKR